MSGLRPWMYWMTAYLWDVVCFLLPTFLFIAVFYAFDEYTNRSEVSMQLVLIMLLFGWAQIPFVYTFSFAFTSPHKGYTLIVMYNIIAGMIGLITVPIIAQAADEDAAYTASMVFSFVFPSYNIGGCFIKIYNNEYGRKACDSVDCSLPLFKNLLTQCCERVYSDNVLGDSGKKGILIELMYFAAQGILFWFTTLMIEYNWMGKLKSAILRRGVVGSSPFENRVFVSEDKQPISAEDSDVASERNTVEHIDPSSTAVVVKNLSSTAVVVKNLQKWYGELCAVDGVTFHVETQCCFVDCRCCKESTEVVW
ncbi:unnamed protein product [Toxocara canis]|uniref:ABC2_membrane domain-containing protein n=1 Tax=Toxocara canis TaxID=6265 RepID=A0A183VGY3_TOXCA|nr:unnamed protein product [Toxocara canis]